MIQSLTNQWISLTQPLSNRWFPEVQNIYYQGNKKRLLPSNQNAKRLEGFFNAAGVLMTNILQDLALQSLDAYAEIFCPPPVRTNSGFVYTFFHKPIDTLAAIFSVEWHFQFYWQDMVLYFSFIFHLSFLLCFFDVIYNSFLPFYRPQWASMNTLVLSCDLWLKMQESSSSLT